MTHQMKIVRAWTDPPQKSVTDYSDYLAEGFQSLDKEGSVIMNKETWSGFYAVLLAAFSDYRYVRTGLRQQGSYVIMSGYSQGTHTADLDLSAVGMDDIPASGRKIVWPKASSKGKVEGDLVVEVQPYGISGSGMDMFLASIMSEV